MLLHSFRPCSSRQVVLSGGAPAVLSRSALQCLCKRMIGAQLERDADLWPNT